MKQINRNIYFYVDEYGNTLKNDQGGGLAPLRQGIDKKGQSYAILETTYRNGDPYQSIHYEYGNWHGHQSLPIHPEAQGKVLHGQRVNVYGDSLGKSKVDKKEAHWSVRDGR